MAGGSHTNFDEQAFGLGAAAASLTLASAFWAGLANYRAQSRAHYQRLHRDALYAALDYYDAQLNQARDEITSLRADNECLRGMRRFQTDARQAIARRTMRERWSDGEPTSSCGADSRSRDGHSLTPVSDRTDRTPAIE